MPVARIEQAFASINVAPAALPDTVRWQPMRCIGMPHVALDLSARCIRAIVGSDQ